jgi:hypothetical protein
LIFLCIFFLQKIWELLKTFPFQSFKIPHARKLLTTYILNFHFYFQYIMPFSFHS